MAEDFDEELVREFLAESHENLDRMDRDLLTLEREPTSEAALGSLFRTLHTIKGTCGFLGFARLEGLAHAGETLLGRLRDGELRLSPAVTTALLQTGDTIRAMLADIETHRGEGPRDPGALIAALGAVAAGAPQPVSAPPPLANAEPMELRSAADGYVRVDVGLLDKLMNLVGELVLARNQIVPFAPRIDDRVFAASAQRLNAITTELQSRVMQMRMQPIGNAWEKVPRMVRDLCATLGKRVRVEMEGGETELDKAILEAVKDPLTHLVRNGVDHGIEPPDVRVARGKPPEGLLSLRAFHEGGQVNIEISDDGAGLDAERIRAKAVDKGLLTPDAAARLGERDLHGLIFVPGFSTAGQISNISGRGVGMDVVKNNIERIGGVIDLQSRPGQGTTFRLKIPLTLAIVPALVVTSGGDRYAIPQNSLLELALLEAEDARARIEDIHGTPVYRLRGTLLPLVDLAAALGGPGTLRAAQAAGAVVHIVVLQAEGRRFGLVVEAVTDTQEIVVKPLGRHLKTLGTYAGATIMGDGRVALILDVVGLAQRAGVTGQGRDVMRTRPGLVTTEARARTTMLLFALGDARPIAVPLAMVARLEVFARDAIERLGDGEVVQYRGEVLRLLEANRLLGAVASPRRDEVSVIVYGDGGRRLGLMVDSILDIVEVESGAIEAPPSTRRALGVYGSAVIARRATELVDLGALLSPEAQA